ncbi:MAG: DUF1592 domain-containing protein [Pirellulaceae bacterium]
MDGTQPANGMLTGGTFWQRNATAGSGPVAAALIALGLFGTGSELSAAEPAKPVPVAPKKIEPAKIEPAAVYAGKVVPFLKKHCYDCHGPDVQEAEIGFHDYLDLAKVMGDERTWTRVLQMIETGVMPPDDSPQPTSAERKQIVADLERVLYNVDCDLPHDPGRVTIRRLNRAEYNNTVRDLLGVTFRPADDFPSDDVGSGFDNIGEVLTLPPLLMEKYLTAAERIAEQTIVADSKAFIKSQRRDRKLLKSEGSVNYDEDRRRWVIVSKGNVWGEFELPRGGQYILRVYARATRAGDEPAEMELRLDGKRLKVFDVNAIDKGGTYEFTARTKAGTHRVSAHFLNDFQDPKAKDSDRRDRNLIIDSFEVDGPIDLRLEDYPEAHRKLVAARPGAKVTAADAARQNLRLLLSRAFRRRASDDEVNTYSQLVEASVEAGDSFEQGMQVALTAVLVSPHFLFRMEDDAGSKDAKSETTAGSVELSDFELATRLSYFIWSSMPDDELFALASAGKLGDAAIREQQVRRMLADPKSDALVQNFATQWLNLRLLDGASPDPQAYPDFSPELKADMRRETELFCQAILREDRSLLDFIEGRFSFVNERLAKHYGLKGIEGDEFQRVAFKDDRRTGVLTQASILTLTSNPARTSPVKRGKWIMENILGSAPPDPPPDVPELEATQKAKPGLSLREQLEIHRASAVCASCHKTMDQLGFGLENFDAVGRWREKDGQLAIDSSGELPNGDTFDGPLEMAGVLKQRQEEFARCLAEKMLTFALGRGLQSPDRCAVDTIVEGLKKQEFRFSALVVEIANSVPFTRRRGEGTLP